MAIAIFSPKLLISKTMPAVSRATLGRIAGVGFVTESTLVKILDELEGLGMLAEAEERPRKLGRWAMREQKNKHVISEICISLSILVSISSPGAAAAGNIGLWLLFCSGPVAAFSIGPGAALQRQQYMIQHH